MRIRSRVTSLVGLLALAVVPLQAQEVRSADTEVAKIREENFRWFFGPQAGVLMFGTQLQTQSGIPAGGLHLGVKARRAGLLLSVDEAFGNDEPTAFEAFDITNDSLVLASPVQFNRIRRYSFTLTAYPVRGPAEPYFGVGFGLLQVINPEITGVYADQSEAAQAQFLADQGAASGFAHFTIGLQFRAGSVAAFGQYQIGTAPGQSVCVSSDECRFSGLVTNNLLRGTTHSLMGGIRIGLGRARQEITGGGY
jgi:hypothetical protein